MSGTGVVIPRNSTLVVTGTGVPLTSKIASGTVNGLNGFWIGTLMPEGLNPTLVPGILNGSGVSGTAARDASKNERTYLKSAKQHQIFVTQIAREGPVEGLAISPRQCGRYSREII
jgi:hypothetical protein